MNSKTLTAGIATLSWIDPKTGLPEVDTKGDPGLKITRQGIKAGKLYRFSNFLDAFIIVGSSGIIQKAGFTDQSEMYRGSSGFGLESAPVGKIGRSISQNRSSATFRQIVGARTESPEKIGSGVGGVLGAGGGAWAGAKLGAVAGSWAGPVGMFVGAVSIGAVGYFAGREIAELVSAFPPIWTELELTIYSDASLSYALVSHSLFPSNTFYALAENAARDSNWAPETYLKQGASYDGDQNKLKQWKENGWGLAPRQRSGETQGNPWGMPDPGRIIGQGNIQQECPVGYQCK